jgi:UDP-3-O-[3-hydroxymyristoyl] glucosamine N-acyltransferase
MSEPVFFKRGPGLTVGELTKLTGARLAGAPPSDDLRITDVAPLERAGPQDIVFVDGSVDRDALRLSGAGACFVREETARDVPPHIIALVVGDPYAAFVRVASALYPGAQRPSSLFEVRGAAAGAFVHPSARIEPGVTIDPAAMIGPHAEIGAGTYVGPMAVIGPAVRVGRDCSLGAGASLTNALVGDGVVVEPGCRIGLARGGNQSVARRPQLGRAILQDKVVVGANSVINRGCERDTIIGEGTMIDALVQIPADAVVGRYCRVMADGPMVEHGTIDVPDADKLQLFASQIRATE